MWNVHPETEMIFLRDRERFILYLSWYWN